MYHFFCAFEGSIRQNAVAEIENMPRTTRRLLDHPSHFGADHVNGRVEHDRVHIALNADIVANGLPSLIEYYAKIDTDDVAPSLTHVLQE